jgi:hypothetical protein
MISIATFGTKNHLIGWNMAKPLKPNSRRRILTKEQALEIIKLLSALESWSFSLKERLPDYLHDKIATSIEVLEKEVLK